MPTRPAKPRLWEDKPPHTIDIRQRLEELVLKHDILKQYVPCGVCHAQRGENCRFAGVPTGGPEDREWFETYDVHMVRVEKWEAYSELERKMMEAALDEEV